jgi:hypothetical protein
MHADDLVVVGPHGHQLVDVAALQRLVELRSIVVGRASSAAGGGVRMRGGSG